MITVHTAGYPGKIRGVSIDDVSGKYFVGPANNGCWIIYKGENGWPQTTEILAAVPAFNQVESTISLLEKFK